MHTTNILAEYIDNNLDGVANDSAALIHLQEENYVVPVWAKDSYKNIMAKDTLNSFFLSP
jgi:hypothetical protein